MLEIERKYLLEPTVEALLSSQKASCKKLTQFYTRVTPQKSVRFRKIGKKYYKTVKIGEGGIREEYEREIPKKEYYRNLSRHIGYIIRKKRCTVEVEGRVYTVDIFRKPLDKRYILEVEFEDKKAYKAFRLPDLWQSHLQKEVTEDEAYKNKNLALFGLPVDSDGQQKAIDALVGKLREYKQRTLAYCEDILHRDDTEDLHQFRISLRKQLSLLDRCSFLCTDALCVKQKRILKEPVAITNQKRDLDVMCQYLTRFETQVHAPQLKNALTRLIDELETMRQREGRYIRAYLQSSRFEEIMQQYTYFLHQQYPSRTSRYGHYAIEPVCDYVILNTFRKIKKMYRSIDWQKESDKIHKLRILCKKLRYLIEEFASDRQADVIVKKLKKVQKALGKFHDAYQQKLVFERLQVHQQREDVQFLMQNIIMPSLHTIQHEDIKKIKKQVGELVALERVFFKYFVPDIT